MFCSGCDFRNFVREEVHSVSRFSRPKHVFPIEINLHFIGVYGGDVLRVQLIRKCCSEFESGRVIIRGDVVTFASVGPSP